VWWWVAAVAVLVLVAVYTVWMAGRIDRSHARAAAAQAALDAHLVRRAAAATKVAEAVGDNQLRWAAQVALDAVPEEREAAENDLTRVLRPVLATAADLPGAPAPASVPGAEASAAAGVPGAEAPAAAGVPGAEASAAAGVPGAGAAGVPGAEAASVPGPPAAAGVPGAEAPAAPVSASESVAEPAGPRPVDAAADGAAPAALADLVRAGRRVALARQVHNDLVRDALALRRRRLVRVLRLARKHPVPAYFDIDDPAPGRA
jgi:hypothetical protein